MEGYGEEPSEYISVASRIMVESDYHDIDHCTQRTWEMVLIVAEVKGWWVEENWDYDGHEKEESWGVVRRLEENWKAFKKGGHHGNRDTTRKGRYRKQRMLDIQYNNNGT